MSMLLRRFGAALLVIWGVVSLTFLLLHMIPGDPIDAMLGESMAVADRIVMRQKLGLDLPLWQQYVGFWQNLVIFDFGQSIHYGVAVKALVLDRLGWTVLLAMSALGFALCLSVPLAVLAVIKKDQFLDHVAIAIATLGIAIPNFVMGLLLILLFAFALNLLPMGGNDSITAIVLPTVTLGTALAAILSRMLRSGLLEVLNDDFIRTARAKGLSGWSVLVKHAMINAALPMLTLLGLQFGALLGGAVITEVVFSWPGIGQLTVDAIQRRDYPVVQVCVMLIATSYVFINMFTDLLYAKIDPRIRLAGV